MTECLRADGFSAVPASPPKKPSELLQRRDYTASAVLLLVNGADPCFRDLAEAARATGAPLKVIVQITGCNEDEIDSELLAKADLLLPIGAPRAEITTRIRSLWSSL
jgi:hypothetical protein